jgi:hypothetical protein
VQDIPAPSVTAFMMTPFTQNRVSAVAWPWMSEKISRADDPHARRRRAVVQAAVAGGIGLLLVLVWHRRILGWVVLALSAGVLFSGLFLPRAFRALEGFGQRLAKFVGAALTWLLLVPFFYLCFLPGSLLLGLLKKDPLKLKFPSDEPTYWDTRPHRMDADYFKKQY